MALLSLRFQAKVAAVLGLSSYLVLAEVRLPVQLLQLQPSWQCCRYMQTATHSLNALAVRQLGHGCMQLPALCWCMVCSWQCNSQAHHCAQHSDLAFCCAWPCALHGRRHRQRAGSSLLLTSVSPGPAVSSCLWIMLQDPPLVSDTNKRTPLLMCHGDMDQVVRPHIAPSATASYVCRHELQGSWPAPIQGLENQAAKLGEP